MCICNALKDRELAAASGDARTVADVFKRCGRRPQCGKCLPDVAQMIEDAREVEGGAQTVAAE
ncbi:(2Fe-2S)-binding protein [Hyphococcus sp.]|uniref:(2Fe-2S)-binding protein n=1 Tax=Hyphococcus sp. TaxID=2038636 RepID=UPI003CCBA5ED